MASPIRADLVEPEAVEWLWPIEGMDMPGRIPRAMISIVGGKKDQGKGLFCAYLAAAVSNARFLDPDTGEMRWGKVLYSAAEDSHSIMSRPRLEAAGANLKNIDLWRFRLPLDFEELIDRMVGDQVDLLVMDPLASHLSGGINRHSDNIRKVSDPLTELIEHTRTSVVVVEHVLKKTARGADPINALGGNSSGIVAAARMAFILGTDPQDPDRRVLVNIKHNICEKRKAVGFEVDVRDSTVGEQPFLIMEPQECDFAAERLLTNDLVRMGRPPSKHASACEWLTNFLYAQKGPILAGKVYESAKHMALSKKAVRKAREDIGVVMIPPGGGRTQTWQLPDELLAILDAATGKTTSSSNVATSSPIPTPDVPAPPVGAPDGEVDGDAMDAELAALLDGKEGKNDGPGKPAV